MNSELLLPVGNIQMALAAIHNGANAIYVGVPGFNARGRSHDHGLEELKEIIDTCHLYGVDVHLALNILIFQDEIPKVIETLKQVIPLGADAFIVQDLGLVKIINELCPEQVVHGSTQMTVTNHEAMDLLSDLNISRFVLGRENSISEIENIRQNTTKELEVFVHGALCVAYSGQCFTSESLGGRSANRGQCAQSCRFEYELIVDGETKQLGDLKYLVSPKDLCGIADIPKLKKIGVNSFKVEGRLKSPEYVASVASSYRQAIDQYETLNLSKAINEMAITYSRGFFNGWLDGVAHQKLVDGSFGSNRGLYLGEVKALKNKKIIISNDIELFPGDGLLLVGKGVELGGPVYQVTPFKNELELGMSKDFQFQNLKVGMKVYLNSREKLYKELKKTFSDKNFFKKIPISLHVKGFLNEKLQLIASDGVNNIFCETESHFEKAQNKSVSEEMIFENLKGLSHTPYTISDFKIELTKDLFINQKEIKLLKQNMVELLNEKRVNRNRKLIPFELDKNVVTPAQTNAKLSVLLRNLDQLQAVQEFLLGNMQYKAHIRNIILDYEFGKDFIKSVQIIKELGLESVIATTRILKPNEYHNFRLIERASPNGLLIRNLGALNYFKEKNYELYGDFSLNVTNSITADYLLNKGLKSICASYDLNNQQLCDLLNVTDASKIEITAHQYMPEFHMEHCVFAAFLSKGNSFRDCGKPCESHHVQLKDMYGNMHEIKADQECRNTMFNAKSMSAASLIPSWMNKGVQYFRFEALHEDEAELIQKLEIYLKLMKGDYSSEDVLSKLGKMENYGVSTGQLLNSKVYKDRKKHV